MAKKQVMPEPQYELVRDEAIYVPKGETVYEITIDQQTVDDLALGICPEALSERMFSLMKWRRDAIRQGVRAEAKAS